MTTIERVSPPGVPSPRGPYSPAVRAGVEAAERAATDNGDARFEQPPLAFGSDARKQNLAGVTLHQESGL